MSDMLSAAQASDGQSEKVVLVPVVDKAGEPVTVDVRRDDDGNLVSSGGRIVKRLAVCERGGQLVLTREREKTDPADKARKRKVKSWSATSALADFADGSATGLFAREIAE